MPGRTLKKIREDRGLSIESLSEKAGVPAKLIEELESKTRMATPKTLGKLITAMEVTQEELAGSGDVWKNIISRDIGEKIRAVREKKKLKLNELSHMVGISLTYLSEIERGNQIPPVETLRKIAGVLDVPVSLFLAEKKTQYIIAEKMKMARKIRGLTQKELAEQAGISPGLVGQLEMGRVNASFKTLKKISEVLNVSVCYLILDQEEVDDIIGGLSPHLRNLLFDSKVQLIIGSICNLEEEKLKMALNFIDMLKNPAIS